MEKISEELFQFLNGEDLDNKQEDAMMLVTVSEDNWPHVAMISVGEVVAINQQELKLAIWSGTTTTSNIIRTGKANIVVVYNGKVNYLRLSLRILIDTHTDGVEQTIFFASVVSVKEDTAKYANILSGVRISLKEPENVVNRWKNTINKLIIIK